MVTSIKYSSKLPSFSPIFKYDEYPCALFNVSMFKLLMTSLYFAGNFVTNGNKNNGRNFGARLLTVYNALLQQHI